MNAADGMNYAPKGKAEAVVKPGEFVFSVAHLDHGHIYGMCNALTEAGATLKYVWDPDPKKVEFFIKTYPQAIPAESEDQVLQDKETMMVAAAAVTSERGPFGVKVMEHGKDYFTDKAPFTTTAQLEKAKETVKKTGKKYMVYYSERLHVEGAILAGYMVDAGEIGKVISVSGFGPHRLGAKNRPEWFFQKEKYGGMKQPVLDMIRSYLQQKPTGTVIIDLGGNDLDNIEAYIGFYRTLLKKFPRATFWFMGVLPREKGDPSNSKRKAFSNRLAKELPGHVIDLYSKVYHMDGFTTKDGTHYNKRQSRKIYQMAMKKMGRNIKIDMKSGKVKNK